MDILLCLQFVKDDQLLLIADFCVILVELKHRVDAVSSQKGNFGTESESLVELVFRLLHPLEERMISGKVSDLLWVLFGVVD